MLSMAKTSGIFVGFSEAQILEIREAARKAISSGKSITSYSDGTGISVSKDWPIDPKELLLECRYALSKLAPDTYGSVRGTRRVHATFAANNGL